MRMGSILFLSSGPADDFGRRDGSQLMTAQEEG
jgi:hypothetical protein